MSRFAAALLFLTCLLAALPAGAARRAALLVDQSPLARSAGQLSVPTAALADQLALLYGFDVVRSNGPDLDKAIEAFRERARGADVSLLLFSGAVSHDQDGTYLLGADARDRIVATVRLDDLLEHMTTFSRAAVVLLEASGTPPSGSKHSPSFGRLPSMSDRLLISAVAAPRGHGAQPSLAAAVASRVKGQVLRPGPLLEEIREQLYIDSFGLRVTRHFGSLPPRVVLDRAPDRKLVMRQIADRARQLCEADYARSAEATESRLLGHLATAAGGLRGATLSEVDTYGLEALLSELLRADACPYIVPAAYTPTGPPASSPADPAVRPPIAEPLPGAPAPGGSSPVGPSAALPLPPPVPAPPGPKPQATPKAASPRTAAVPRAAPPVPSASKDEGKTVKQRVIQARPPSTKAVTRPPTSQAKSRATAPAARPAAGIAVPP